MKADWLVRSDSARHIPEDLVWATIPPHIHTSPWPPTLKRCENAAIRETHLYIQLQLVGKRKRLITTGSMLWIYIFKPYPYPLYIIIIIINLNISYDGPTVINTEDAHNRCARFCTTVCSRLRIQRFCRFEVCNFIHWKHWCPCFYNRIKVLYCFNTITLLSIHQSICVSSLCYCLPFVFHFIPFHLLLLLVLTGFCRVTQFAAGRSSFSTFSL